MTEQTKRERIAQIIAPDLYGSPFGYPDGIESDNCLTAARNIALAKADAILAAISSGQRTDG